MGTTTKVQRLRCKLTAREREQKTDELMRLMSEVSRLKAEKAAAAKRFAGLIHDAEKAVDEVAEDVRDCSELRSVECFERPNYTLRTVEIVRGDLGEVISTRPMGDSDLQTAFEQHGNVAS